ncbi:hypothetical protein ABPG74_002482 [Tetrahymena malaccensis]
MENNTIQNEMHLECQFEVKIQQQIQMTQQKNSVLLKEVTERLQEKQYQATLGIGNIFYAIVGFIFQYQSESLLTLTIPNILFYLILIYYILYSYRIISQYLIIMNVHEEISKENVLSFSIDLEINKESDIKKSFQNTLLDRITFNNTLYGLFGFSIFAFHFIYIFFLCYDDSQSVLFLAIIFTGYYINIFIYAVLLAISTIKKLIKKFKKVEKSETLCQSIIQNDQCCICMDSFKKGEVLQQYSCCNNIFHTNCILNWKQVSNTCPLCRQNI